MIRFVLTSSKKPANILLCEDSVKLSDFGLSKLLPVGRHYKSTKIVGTPIFSSPEVLSGDSKNEFACLLSKLFSIT